MNRSYLLPAAIAAAVVFGCTSMDQDKDEAPAEKTRVTGSRIPPRDSAGSASTQTSTDRNPVGGIVPGGNVNIQPAGAH